MGSFAGSTKRKVWDRTDGHCWYCGKQLVWVVGVGTTVDLRGVEFMTIDHFVPRHEQGRSGFKNLVPCCKTCNCRKSRGTVEHVRERLAVEMGIVLFSKEQVAYLEAHSINVPEVEMPQFYFERMGFTL